MCATDMASLLVPSELPTIRPEWVEIRSGTDTRLA